MNELNLEKIGKVIFKEKQFENKNSVTNLQQENKINQLNQSFDKLTNKYFTLNKNLLVPIYENYYFKNKIDINPTNQNEINPESDKLNNLCLYYIEKLKNLT